MSSQREIKKIEFTNDNKDSYYGTETSFSGLIIIEDGCFKGIVNYNYFVFGTIEDDVIEVIVAEINDNKPTIVYNATFNENAEGTYISSLITNKRVVAKYDGNLQVKGEGYEFDIPDAKCQVTIKDLFFYCSIEDEDFELLDTRINYLSEGMHYHDGSDGSELYSRNTRALYERIFTKRKKKSKKRKPETTQ